MILMAPWLVLVVAIVLAVMWASQRRQAPQEADPGPGSPSNRWNWPVAAVLAATLVVVLLAWLGMSTWGGTGLMGSHMGWGGSTSSSSQVVEGAREVEVEAGDLWFEPDTVQVTAGEPVNLLLVNTGDSFHDLTVPAADVVLAAEPGEQATGAVEFSEPGRYEFLCSVPGHEQGGMRGTFVVSAAD